MASSLLLVAAIDFGTSFSGWAFSFNDDFKRDPTYASVRKWHSGPGTPTTEKLPTVALINPDGKTLKAFGYDAEKEYRNLFEGEHEKYYFFQGFKMMLHKKLREKLYRNISIEDAMGRSLPALDVFSLSIKYLIDDMMKVVTENSSRPTIVENEILWVITVPAIWTDSAKQFMREAGTKAGIATQNLVIALESEIASVFCRHLSVDTTGDDKEVSLATYPEGAKYIVLDAGGGTIDITVHEVVPEGVKEIEAASGGNWGGAMVNKAFESLLKDIVGVDVYDSFKKEETSDWLALLQVFEVKKSEITHDEEAEIIITFPMSMKRILEDKQGRTLASAIASTLYADEISLDGDDLKFSPVVLQNLFSESVNLIIDHIKKLKTYRRVRAILMVGGYSESPMLQHAVKTTFKDLEVVIPPGASSTILRGALIYGHSPTFITGRVLKYTYGIPKYRLFIQEVNGKRKVVATDIGAETGKGLFKKYVGKGDKVKYGQILADKYICFTRPQEYTETPIFASELNSPVYTDNGVTQIGTISPQDGDHSKIIEVVFQFGGTEIQVEGFYKKTMQKTKISLTFLG